MQPLGDLHGDIRIYLNRAALSELSSLDGLVRIFSTSMTDFPLEMPLKDAFWFSITGASHEAFHCFWFKPSSVGSHNEGNPVTGQCQAVEPQGLNMQPSLLPYSRSGYHLFAAPNISPAS